MRIPTNCRYSIKPPPREAAELIACCRVQARYRLIREDEEPLCRTMRAEAEVYRLTWRSSFDGDAAVRIGRQGDQITLHWIYRWYTLRGAEGPVVRLSLVDWARLQDALFAASFWALDPEERRLGLDGSQWLIEGRRKDNYRAVSRWSPHGAIYDLGKLFFELTGPPLTEVTIY
jgi:hypothetical protein